MPGVVGMVRRVLVGALVVVVALVAVALLLPDDDLDGPAAAAVDGEDARDDDGAVERASFGGEVEETDCPVDTSSFVVQVTCGVFTAPALRDDPAAGEVGLAFAVLHAEELAAADPVLYLSGGPGASAVAELEEWTYDGLLASRDVILLDQRGTGWSTPDLTCPEVDGVSDAYAAEQACRDRLESEGVDLRLLRTAETAADVAALREALGYETWNLWGSSYGTRVAMTVLRDDPTGIRSVVLEGAYPHQIDAYLDATEGRLAALDRLDAACDVDADCSATVGDLRGLLDELVAALDEDPVGLDDGTVLDGRTLVEIVFSGLGGSRTLGAIPGWLGELADGGTDPFEISAERRGFSDAEVADSPATFYVIECAEEVAHSPLADVAPEQVWDELGIGETDLVGRYAATVVAETLASCDIWDTGGTDPIEDAPVTTDVPVLVYAGLLDPQTPPWWGEAAAEALGDAAWLLELPHRAHDTIDVDPCGRALFEAFIDDPEGFEVTCELEERIAF
ncbi:alpha/beta hydrolase [Nitriliruptoraceae bacterium ZYF776]|nr:alpha/beta hydrolase [Profundirhabdus halotolerans]